MPKDNNITNSQDGNAAINEEAEAHHHNIPGDEIVKAPPKEDISKNTEASKQQVRDVAGKSVPD